MKDLKNYLKMQVAEGMITDTIEIEKDNGVFAFYCKEEQGVHTFLFDKDKWEEKEAQKWAEDNKERFTKREEPKMLIKKKLDFLLKGFDDEKLTFNAIASTSDIDRDGDTLQVKGWVLKNFKKNPVLLWGHNANMLPIGKAENVRIEDDKLVFTPVFTPKEINPLGEQVYRMFKANFLNAFSVRFDPIDWEERKAEEGDDKRRVGYNYKKQELLEISPVTVPSLPQALASRDYQNMIMKGFLTENSGVIENEKDREEFLKNLPKVCVKCKKEKPAEDITKENEELKKAIEELKSGRVLSEKNRSLIKLTVESMSKASESLNQLVEATEPAETDDESDKELKKLKAELDNILSIDIEDDGIKDLIVQGKALLDVE